MHWVGIGSLIVAMGVSWIFTPLVIRLAGRLGAVDLPGGRKTHSGPTPRIGGLAVYLGFVVGLAFTAHAMGVLFELPRVNVYWIGLAIAATSMLLVGLIDDLWHVSYKWKFVAQVAAGIFVWFCGFRLEVITSPFGGSIDLQWLSLPITLLWIVGITNAVNLIDGLDGLAAGIALIITGTLAVIAFAAGQLGLMAACVALAGSLIGFLWFNFNPARIFLGDSGSLFLGFVLAVASLRASQKGPAAVAILAPLLVMGLPLMDTSLTVLRRLYWIVTFGSRTDNTVRYVAQNLHRVFMPDRSHIHHRLIDLGLSHRRAVLTLYAVGALFAAAAYALVLSKSLVVGFLLTSVLVLLMAAFFAVLYLRTWWNGRHGQLGTGPDNDGSQDPAGSGDRQFQGS